MVKEVILHIGSPKAGSSSIQASLRDFDDGETFYASLGEVNHTLPIIVLFLDDKSKINRKTKKILTAITRKERYLKKLEGQLSRKDRERIIISGEGIAHKLKDKEKSGLGLGLFIGKTVLENNFAKLIFRNSESTGGAEVTIRWKNKDLFNL